MLLKQSVALLIAASAVTGEQCSPASPPRAPTDPVSPRPLAHSHEGPKSAEEKASLAKLKQASYLCAPQIALYNQERQRQWAQKALGGASYSDQKLFLSEAAGVAEGTGKEVDKILACHDVAPTEIRNHTCVLAPEVTEGPYFHDGQHPIRSNLAELKDGLPMNMQIGLIDVNTCEPISNVLLDLWHCDALGYYAGHPRPHAHLTDELPASTGHRKGLLSAYPNANDGETWLRGAQISDQNGIVEFQSIFPGYYTGRATHWHIRVHPEYEVYDNATYTGKTLAHTGQLFVPDDINSAVDMMYPYVNNHLRTMPGRGRTRNWQDSLNIFEDSQIGGYQSMWDMHYMGSVISQGLQGFITVVINSTADHSAVKWSVEQGKEKLTATSAVPEPTADLHTEL